MPTCNALVGSIKSCASMVEMGRASTRFGVYGQLSIAPRAPRDVSSLGPVGCRNETFWDAFGIVLNPLP